MHAARWLEFVGRQVRALGPALREADLPEQLGGPPGSRLFQLVDGSFLWCWYEMEGYSLLMRSERQPLPEWASPSVVRELEIVAA